MAGRVYMDIGPDGRWRVIERPPTTIPRPPPPSFAGVSRRTSSSPSPSHRSPDAAATQAASPLQPQHDGNLDLASAVLSPSAASTRAFDTMVQGHQAPTDDEKVAAYDEIWDILGDFYTELEWLGPSANDQQLLSAFARNWQRIWDTMPFSFDWDKGIRRP
ncbi:uncharacterized protein PSANT_01629 [Moesziomyces antarcticus]|uniref:Uncharacterized protein n=2 Tax=Pseudozyma antarctica TaxID=84753 RepID=A0A5C3FHW7_PSEA2|nr:uncharacterized protein PSANT_01629 [Moesziomyces antarcticus]